MEIPGEFPMEGVMKYWDFAKKNELTRFLQCSISVYPFHDGKMEDFEPVFLDLIKARNSLADFEAIINTKCRKT